MFKDSSELLDFALRELQVATAEDKSVVEIILKSPYSGEDEEVIQTFNNLHIGMITEILRLEYDNYEIRSQGIKRFVSNLSFRLSNCSENYYYQTTVYAIVWKITLQKK